MTKKGGAPAPPSPSSTRHGSQGLSFIIVLSLFVAVIGLTSLIRLLEGADATPTATQVGAVADRRAAIAKPMALCGNLPTPHRSQFEKLKKRFQNSNREIF